MTASARTRKGKKRELEKLGIDPNTSRMLSERSTIWATSPCWWHVRVIIYFLAMQEGDHHVPSIRLHQRREYHHPETKFDGDKTKFFRQSQSLRKCLQLSGKMSSIPVSVETWAREPLVDSVSMTVEFGVGTYDQRYHLKLVTHTNVGLHILSQRRSNTWSTVSFVSLGIYSRHHMIDHYDLFRRMSMILCPMSTGKPYRASIVRP